MTVISVEPSTAAWLLLPNTWTMTHYNPGTMKTQLTAELCLAVFKPRKLSLAIITALNIVHIARSYIRYFNILESARAQEKEAFFIYDIKSLCIQSLLNCMEQVKRNPTALYDKAQTIW